MGVPSGDVGSVAAGLTGVGNVAADATRQAEKQTDALADNSADAAADLSDTQLSFIKVEVIGFGDS